MATNELMTMYLAAQQAFRERNYAIAESILRAGAERGHPNSQCMLGLLYERGRGVPKDLQLALEWYHKAAAQDYADAQVSIGRCYHRGVGVPQDYGQAVLWFQKAADAGFADGQFELGRMYETGNGVPQDYEQSFYWYSKAAAQGLDIAQHKLGAAYTEGLGVESDPRLAFEWFSKAAEQGDADSTMQRNNRLRHYDEFPKPEEMPEVFEATLPIVRVLAEHGHVLSQFSMGEVHLRGWGAPQDLSQSAEWYRKAAEQGHAVVTRLGVAQRGPSAVRLHGRLMTRQSTRLETCSPMWAARSHCSSRRVNVGAACRAAAI
jgi:TPR repeat protein